MDMVSFAGAGRWNGTKNYTFTAEASDLGEPGRGRDRFTITIRSPKGAIVATATGVITSGNIQPTRARGQDR